MPLLPWIISDARPLYETTVFTLCGHTGQSQLNPAKKGQFVYLDAPNWVNVIALTANDEVVLIEQYRHGTQQMTLEIPGGMCDAGEGFIAAAERELREETGGVGTAGQLIGIVDPNPAIQNNRCATILIRNVQLKEQELDGNEEITVKLSPLIEIPSLIRTGVITHALVVTAFHHLHLLEHS